MKLNYILTDGRCYVMRDPIHPDRYIKTTGQAHATKFTYKQAKSLIGNKRKSTNWIREFDMIDVESGEMENKYYKGKEDSYIGKNDVQFDYGLIGMIFNESNTIMNLKGFEFEDLCDLKNRLNIELSKCDSAISDIEHAMEEYRKNNGKNPPAHKLTMLAIMLTEVRIKHADVKQCMSYLGVYDRAIKNKWSIPKVIEELKNAKHPPYKGRTEYYQRVVEILER